MASKTLHTNQITFMDLTDDRKLDVYIASNLPITQIKDNNANPNTYTPDWSSTNLVLSADVYLDSQDITDNTGVSMIWYEQIGTSAKTQVGTSTSIIIKTNKMTSSAMVTYSCDVTYQGITAHSQITFTRVDTGINGSDGNDAPTVQAQYSVDGTTGWTSTLNAATHKYIRHSYDGGKTWTTAIKMVGEDGTSVRIKGTATSVTSVTDTDYYTLVYDGSSITGAELGDAYLYNGDLYVCANSRDGADYFINVGAIQGPAGNDGLSSYVFIRYATDANGTGMSTSPSGKTYMGVYTSNTNVAPTTASVYTWSKFVGDSAKSIVLSGDSQVFKMSTSNVATPTTIKVTAQAFNTSVTTWTYSTNGGQTFVSTAPTGVARNGNIVTVTGSTLTTNSIVVKASDGTVEDVFTVYKAFDGANGNPGAPGTPASMAFLTNENVTFSANASGVITSATISTNVVAYNGATKTTPTVGTIANLPTGMTATVGTVVNNEVPIVFTVTNSNLGSALNNNGSITIPVNGPVYTNLILTWSKVNSGAQGGIGPKGSDAYTVLLTNESHVFAGDVSNAEAGTAETQALAYIGTTQQTVKIISVNEKTAAIIDTDTGIAGLKFKCDTLSGTSPKITFTCTTAFTQKSGVIPVKLSVGGVEFTKMFTYSIAFKGATGGIGNTGPAGAPATSYWLVSSASAVQKTSTGTVVTIPSTLTFTGKSKTGTGSPINYACRWIIAYSTDGSTYTNAYTSTADEASRTFTVATTYKAVRVRMYMAGGTTSLLDEQIIPVISDGMVDLNIGGTNLLRGTKDFVIDNTRINGWRNLANYTITTDEDGFAVANKLNSSETSNVHHGIYSSVIKATMGDKFVVSFWMKVEDISLWDNQYPAILELYDDSMVRIAWYDCPLSRFNINQSSIQNDVWIYCTLPFELNSSMFSFTTGKTWSDVNFFGVRLNLAKNGNIYFKKAKLERGNKATDWSPAPEDLKSTTFQIYAPNGSLLTNELQSLTLQTFAYDGSMEITSGATFQWSHLIDDVWTTISGATGTTLIVTKSDVLRAKSYRCVMTYKSKIYTSTITVQDKTDAYNSIMCMSSNAMAGECYWVLYTLVYSDTGEIDPLLGPISINAPTSPVSGDYWYAVDAANATVQLKKYNGTTWSNSTDKQSLTYLWNIVNDGSLKTPIGGDSKVQVVSCHDFTATATLMCDVSNEVDGVLTQSSLSITDASDPIVSETEPTGIVNGQIWIKPNSNGTYFMSVWDATNNTWISSDMDTRNKVYTSKPTSYSKGDIWITESNAAHGSYREGTLLVASVDSVTYNASHWSATLKYDKDISEIEKTLYNLSQYVDITTLGLRIGARNSAGELSPFTSLFTSTELAFYQNSEKLLTLANNQLTAPRVVVEEDLEVQGSISLGGLQFTIETNGSFSFAVKT